jgi:predicted nucleic acid-binding protein
MLLSEPAKPVPNGGAVAWLEEQSPLDLAISVITIGEIARGVARLEEGKRKRELQNWLLRKLPEQFADRVLDIDADVARVWGQLTAEADNSGRPLPVVDGLILATAKVNALTLVTRNMDDFNNRGLAVLNPYSK